MQNWETVWNNRTEEVKEYPIEELLRLNGYDQEQSRLTKDTIYQACEKFANVMRTRPGDSVYELGCGAGAFLHYFKNEGYRIGGSDLSSSLSKIAKESLGGEFTACPANELKCSGRWDHVLAFGLFMYFPNYDYAKDVITRMMIKSCRTVSVFDIPDLAKKEECEQRRRELIGPSYDDKYKGLEHMYYPKSWWIDIAETLGLEYAVYDQNIPGYKNSAYRYNVTFLL
jgi:hypothetical protein